MTVHGSCHCGANRFTVEAAPEEVSTCNCSYCSKTGVVWAYYLAHQFKLMTLPSAERLYRFNFHEVDHLFCPTCGCTTYERTATETHPETGQTRRRIGINARLLDDFDWTGLPEEKLDGKSDPVAPSDQDTAP